MAGGATARAKIYEDKLAGPGSIERFPPDRIHRARISHSRFQVPVFVLIVRNLHGLLPDWIRTERTILIVSQDPSLKRYRIALRGLLKF